MPKKPVSTCIVSRAGFKSGTMLVAVRRSKTYPMSFDPVKQEKLEFRVLSWLGEKGFDLIARNWQYCHEKIDVIASRLGRLHFIGISTIHYPSDERSDECITRRRMLAFLQASKQYLQRHPEWKNACIDILTIQMVGEEPSGCDFTANIAL